MLTGFDASCGGTEENIGGIQLTESDKENESSC